jgi:hypothetical protein
MMMDVLPGTTQGVTPNGVQQRAQLRPIVAAAAPVRLGRGDFVREGENIAVDVDQSPGVTLTEAYGPRLDKLKQRASFTELHARHGTLVGDRKFITIPKSNRNTRIADLPHYPAHKPMIRGAFTE